MKSDRKFSFSKVSVVIPVFNEAEVFEELYQRLNAALLPVVDNVEYIFIDDGSTDDTASKVQKLSQTDPHVKGIELSRNFGQQAAVTAGLSFATGDAVVLMDADLQDPPEIIPGMLERLAEGYDVVFARRVNRKEGVAKRAAFKLFYKLLRMSARGRIPMDAGLFCAMNQSVADQMRAFGEKNRFLPGLRAWAGFRQSAIDVERGERYDQEPRVSWRGLARLAMDAIFSFSYLPLRIVTLLGFIAAIPSFVYMLFVLYAKLFTAKAIPGWASTLSAVLLLGGLQLISLGIIGEYIGRIYDEVKNRPIFIVRRTHGFGR